MALLIYLLVNLLVWFIVIHNMRSTSFKAAALVQQQFPEKWQQYAQLGDKQGSGRWRYSYMWRAIKKSPGEFEQTSNLLRLARVRDNWLAAGLACIPITSIIHSFFLS